MAMAETVNVLEARNTTQTNPHRLQTQAAPELHFRPFIEDVIAIGSTTTTKIKLTTVRANTSLFPGVKRLLFFAKTNTTMVFTVVPSRRMENSTSVSSTVSQPAMTLMPQPIVLGSLECLSSAIPPLGCFGKDSYPNVTTP